MVVAERKRGERAFGLQWDITGYQKVELLFDFLVALRYLYCLVWSFLGLQNFS